MRLVNFIALYMVQGVPMSKPLLKWFSIACIEIAATDAGTPCIRLTGIYNLLCCQQSHATLQSTTRESLVFRAIVI